jgi:V8-like Glu-specific endopeptidase
MKTSRIACLLLAGLLLSIARLPAAQSATGEPVTDTLFKATESYVKSLLDKAGYSPRTMNDGDVAIDWHDSGQKFPGYVSFGRNDRGQVWSLRIAAVMPPTATGDIEPEVMTEFANRWNRTEDGVTLFTGENGVLVASTNMPVEFGINPEEFEANGLRRLDRTLPRILKQLDEFAATYKSTRQKADTSRLPAQAVGLLELPDGYCTASVVAPDVILTAAHCLFNSADKEIRAKRFRAAYANGTAVAEAGIRDQFVSPDFDEARIFASDGMEGHDWAFLRLDRPVGDKTGILAIKGLGTEELEKMIDAKQYQVVRLGYGSSKMLTLQTGCSLAHVWNDNTYAHLCRIEPGDSGSPVLLVENGSYSIIGIDEAIIDIRDVKRANVAVSSNAFVNALPEFLNRAPTSSLSDPSSDNDSRAKR